LSGFWKQSSNRYLNAQIFTASFDPRVTRIASPISDAQIFVTPIEQRLATINGSISERSDIHGFDRAARDENRVIDI
jgi:hypothetical protein